MNNNFFLFFVYTSFTLLFAELQIELLDYDKLAFARLSEYYSIDDISNILAIKKKWGWLGYIIAPIITLLKISIIATILDVGCFFFDKEIKYKKIFNIVVKAEFVFLLVIISKTVWFYFFQTDSTIEDIDHFYPLSALNIIGYEGLQSWFIYPLQVLNLFEFAYFFILAYLLNKEINSNNGLSVVLSSYGVALLIWVVGVMFFTLNMS